jgi:hypothetical protein
MFMDVMASLDGCSAHGWPIERFAASRLSSLVPALDKRRLLQWCQGLDRLSSQRTDRFFVGLEIDHRSHGSVDCYLCGGEEVFSVLESEQLPRISSRFQRWLPSIYHLEYDYSKTGYGFAGFSQRCAFDGASQAEIQLVLEDFIALNVDPSAVAALAVSGIDVLIAGLGGPIHLAVMSGRHRHWLKLVLPLDVDTLKVFRTQLLGGRLAQRLAHLCDALPLLESCLALLPKGACKLSLDLDLGSAAVSERIGLEMSIPRRDAVQGSRQAELLSRILHSASGSIQGCQQMLALQRAIPYGERHSRGWIANRDGQAQLPMDQLFVVIASHIKLCLLPQSRWVKSYLGLCRLLVTNSVAAH